MRHILSSLLFLICLGLYSETNLVENNWIDINSENNHLRNLPVPQNITIAENNGEIELTWDPVDADINGNPLTPDYYNIYKTEVLEEPSFQIIGTSLNNVYVIPEDISTTDVAFFKVTAVKEASGGLDPNFLLVAGGSFNNDVANITISSFYISKYEVTQVEYEAIIGSNPALDNGVGDNYPVHDVSWFDAIKYCNLRSMEEELTPCYSYDDNGSDPAQWPNGWNTSSYNHNYVYCDFSANGYRLPTEMEWMFAAKGGNMTPEVGYPIYSGTSVLSELANYAWYLDNNDPDGTKPVGTKNYNLLGLYDMSGNVAELCWDKHRPLTEGEQTDPVGPDTGTSRITRGGSFYNSATICQVNYRSHQIATFATSSLGFRLVRSLD